MPANPADPGSVSGAHTQPRPATVLGPLLRALLLLLAVLWLAPQPILRPIAALLAAAQAATTAEDYPAAADALANAAARLPYDAYLIHRAGLSEISAGRLSLACPICTRSRLCMIQSCRSALLLVRPKTLFTASATLS